MVVLGCVAAVERENVGIALSVAQFECYLSRA